MKPKGKYIGIRLPLKLWKPLKAEAKGRMLSRTIFMILAERYELTEFLNEKTGQWNDRPWRGQ